jgi:hypothetical protein
MKRIILPVEANGKFVEILDDKRPGIGLIIDAHEVPSIGPYITLLSGKSHTIQSMYLSKDAICRILNVHEIKKLFNPIEIVKGLSLTGCQNGTDPEVFVVNKDDIIIPAFTFLPDKKKGNPFWDGFQAEFTVAATHCLAYMVDNIRTRLLDVRASARKNDKDAKLTWKSVIDIPYNIMKETDSIHLALGCTPSLNVYGTETRIIDPTALPFRFAGCHLHFGLAAHILPNKSLMNNMIKSMDSFIGVISIALLQGMEDPRRRLFYGLAGEHRFPKHGIEYRVLSSAILAHPALFHLCYDLARASLFLIYGYPLIIPNTKSKEREVINIINSYDVRAAKKYINEYKTIIIAVIEKVYHENKSKVKRLFNLIIDGFMNNIDISDMEKNWRLDQTWEPHSGSMNCSVDRLALPSKLEKD